MKLSDEIVELLKKSNRDYKQTIIMINHNTEIAKVAEMIFLHQDLILHHQFLRFQLM